jgi:hypothetical protein
VERAGPSRHAVRGSVPDRATPGRRSGHQPRGRRVHPGARRIQQLARAVGPHRGRHDARSGATRGALVSRHVLPRRRLPGRWKPHRHAPVLRLVRLLRGSRGLSLDGRRTDVPARLRRHSRTGLGQPAENRARDRGDGARDLRDVRRIPPLPAIDRSRRELDPGSVLDHEHVQEGRVCRHAAVVRANAVGCMDRGVARRRRDLRPQLDRRWADVERRSARGRGGRGVVRQRAQPRHRGCRRVRRTLSRRSARARP